MNIEELKLYIKDLKALLEDAMKQLADQANPTQDKPAPKTDGMWEGPDQNGGFTYEPIEKMKDNFANGNRVERFAAVNSKELNDLFVTLPFEVSAGYEKWVEDNYNEAQRRRIFLSSRAGYSLKPVYGQFYADPGPHGLPNRTRPGPESLQEGYSLIWAGNVGIGSARERFEAHVKGRLAFDLYNKAANQVARLDRVYEGLSSTVVKGLFLANNPGYEYGPRVSTEEHKSTEVLTVAGVTTSATGLVFGQIGDWFVGGGWLQLLSGVAIVATIVFQVRQDRRQQSLFDRNEEKKDDDPGDK
jgi:hypothetical protein